MGVGGCVGVCGGLCVCGGGCVCVCVCVCLCLRVCVGLYINMAFHTTSKSTVREKLNVSPYVCSGHHTCSLSVLFVS